MLLTIIGITESSKVAVGIFLFHLGTLAVLLLSGGLYLLTNGLAVLASNYTLPSEQGLPAALFFGFAASMLGISGFESSANFVEEQAEGVFPRTLRNMWVAVSVLNPTLALLALALVPIPDVATHEEALLAHMGGIAAGEWLAWLISIDAILVLSGAVLTSYVGVTGLVRRMTLDPLPAAVPAEERSARHLSPHHRPVLLRLRVDTVHHGGRARSAGRGLHALVPVGDGAVSAWRGTSF